MIEWKTIKKDGKPQEPCMCWINNIRAGTECHIAIYDPIRDIFKEYNPQSYSHPALEVTHYVQIPYAPMEEQ